MRNVAKIKNHWATKAVREYYGRMGVRNAHTQYLDEEGWIINVEWGDYDNIFMNKVYFPDIGRATGAAHPHLVCGLQAIRDYEGWQIQDLNNKFVHFVRYAHGSPSEQDRKQAAEWMWKNRHSFDHRYYGKSGEAPLFQRDKRGTIYAVEEY